MKNTKLLWFLVLLSAGNIYAQSWDFGGNNLPAGGERLGSNNNRPVIFETNNTERARLLNTSGFWGFGTAAPNAQVNINSAAGIDALRVQVAGSSKLFVHNDGGVSIGTASAPPANGYLYPAVSALARRRRL